MRARATALLAVGAALAVPATAAADWPVYGHDLSNTRDAGTEGPAAADVGSLQQAWKFDSPTGDFTGTPVVAGGVVVAGDHGGNVYAIDAVTGKERWSKDLGAAINGTAAIDTAAPGGATAYVPVAERGGPRLVALALADGAQRWDTTLTDQEDASVYGSPTFWKGTLYIGTSGPNNDDTRARGSVVALDERSGAIRWQTYTVPEGSDGAAVWATPAIDRATGRLYVGTGNNYHEPTTETSDAMLALDARTGTILDGYQATPNDSFAPDNLTAGPDWDFGASPNLFDGPDGRKLVGEGQKSGKYWALDRATMDPVWEATVGPGGYLGGIIGSTAFDGERIYGADALDGAVFALGRDGSAPWTARDGGGTHFGPTTVANDVVYTMDPTGTVVARDPASGAEVGRLSLGAPAFGGLSATGRALYVAVGTGPPPEPAPQRDSPGSIVAFGDTSASGARPAAPRSRMRLTVRPRRVRAGRRVTLRFRVRRAGRPVRSARIRLAGHRVRTNRRGRARMRIRFHKPGVRIARARRKGVGHARARVRVRPARRRARLQAAGNGKLADFKFGLSSRKPGSPSGFEVHVKLHRADDPDAKPSPLRSAVLRLPDGIRYDTSTLPECMATDEELRTLGADACPEETKLTVGSFSAILGFGPPADPIQGDDHVFNGPDQIIEVISAPGTPFSPGFDRLTLEGTTFTAHPPMSPGGPPDGEAAVRSIDFAVPVKVAGGKSLVTTPPSCPASGQWTSSATFGFADGTSEMVRSRTPCDATPKRVGRPRMRLSVRPRRVAAGRATRLKFRVRSSARRCVRGATVLLRGASARTNRRGRAALTTLFHAPGPRRARVTKPGCGPAHATVRVMRAGGRGPTTGRTGSR